MEARVPVRSSTSLTAAAALGLAALLSTAHSRASEPTKQECVAANEAAQDLRQAGKFLAARAKLSACTAASCPALVREDCTQRLDELEKAMPTVVFHFEDIAGRAVTNVSLSVDGGPPVVLEGAALPLDPGQHVLRFEGKGRLAVGKAVVLREGEKDKLLWVVMGAAEKPAPQATDAFPNTDTAEPVPIETRHAGARCKSDTECASGACDSDRCSEKLRRIWVGLSLQLDLFAMPSSLNACMVPPAPNVSPNLDTPNAKPGTAGYTCLDPNSSRPFPQFGSVRNSQILPSGFDRVSGGYSFGNLRIVASMDYAVDANLLLGGRAGYVLFTDPATVGPGAAFAPIHLEARVTYLFGRRPLIAHAVAPMVFGAAGLGEFDAFVPLTVEANVPMGATTARQRATENAWLTTGPVFLAAGAGGWFPLGNRMAASLAIKIEVAFGGTAGALLGLAPEFGLQYGL
jgi:hypothetical protein